MVRISRKNILISFLLLFMTISCIPYSFAQSKKQKQINAIDRFVHQVDNGMARRIDVPKAELSDQCWPCDAMDYSIANDSIVKITKWILHIRIKKLAYYFQNNELIYFEFGNKEPAYSSDKERKEEIVEQTIFYFNKEKPIRMVQLGRLHSYKKKDWKQILANGKELLNSTAQIKR